MRRPALLDILVFVLAALLGVYVALRCSWELAKGAPAVWLDTFDGQPAAPHPDYFRERWDVTLDGSHNGAMSFAEVQAHHGPDCAAAPATHTVASFANTVFLCNDHWMFALGQADSRPVTVLTPGALLDFSAGPATVSFEITTSRGSDREWIEFWLTPGRQAGRSDFDRVQTEPNSQGVDKPRDSLGLDQEAGANGGFRLWVTRDNSTVDLGEGTDWRTFLTPSAVRRDRFVITLSRTHVSFCMPDYGRCLIDSPLSPPLGWDNAVFQIKADAYNAPKGACVDLCVDEHRSNTWHIDNVRIEPALPFAIVRSTRQFVRNSSGGDGPGPHNFHFVSPAPVGAFLKFTGGGGSLAPQELSIDNGQTFQLAMPREKQGGLVSPEHATTFMLPVPADTISVIFRDVPWNRTVRDVTLWSLSSLTLPSPSATPPATTPTALPAPTNTPTSPTITPVVVGTATPSLTPLSSSTPTATPLATATATPTPSATPSATPQPVPERCYPPGTLIEVTAQGVRVRGAEVAC